MTRKRREPGEVNVNRNTTQPTPGYGGRAYGIMGSRVSYADVNPNALLEAIDAITERGDAIMLSLSADGGVYSIRVYSGKASYPFYPKDAAACEELMARLTATAREE